MSLPPPINPLEKAAVDAFRGILEALDDNIAAALIARASNVRPVLRKALLEQLQAQASSPSCSTDTTADHKNVDTSEVPPVMPQVGEPRKKVRWSSEAKAKDLPQKGANGGDTLDLAVHFLSGRLACTVIAYTNDLVAVLKSEIERLEGTPVWRQQLLIDEHTLEDQEKLQSYCFGINDKGQKVVTLAKRDRFIPASAFQQIRPGYSFYDGEYGLGYYPDTDQGDLSIDAVA